MREDKIISEVKMHLSSIEDILSTLEKSQNKDESGIDSNEIEQFARQASFNRHFIQKYDRDIVIEYCTLLASFVRYCDDTVKRIKQYYFIARILYSAVNDYKLTDIITNAELIEYTDFKNIGEVLDNRSDLFIFDSLLMISMDGQQEEKQMEYLLEVAAFANVHKKDLINICKVCTCILEGKKEELYEYAGLFQIVEASYYLENPIIYPIVTTLEEINNQKEAEVLIVGAHIKNTELDLDIYEKEKLMFYNCKFENVSSIRAKNVLVEFKKCSFCDCKRENDAGTHYYLEYDENKHIKVFEELCNHVIISLCKAYFYKCLFERCCSSNGGWSSLISLEEGDISDCNFVECNVEVNGVLCTQALYRPEEVFASLLSINGVSVDRCNFLRCKCIRNVKRGNLASVGFNHRTINYISLVYCRGGDIDNCKFDFCECQTHTGCADNETSMINGIGTMIKDNNFSECICSENIVTREYDKPLFGWDSFE